MQMVYCIMKLHNPQFFHRSCAITALEIVTGLKQRTIERRILEARERFPLDARGYSCRKTEMYEHTDTVFHNELIAFLRKRGIKARMKHVEKPFWFFDIPKMFFRGTYLCIITSHALVLRNGLVWDNQGINQYICNYRFRNDKLLCYAKLIDFP